MIEFLGAQHLAAYRGLGDPVKGLLGDPRAAGCESERWLRESEAKRMVAWYAYGPLFGSAHWRVLDVGAGHSSLSYELAARHRYRAVDLEHGPDGIPTHVGDWTSVSAQGWDVVVSVDLFPNVDQRLALFLALFDGVPKRLVLTTYRNRAYRARRPEGEWLTVRAWDWEQTRRTLGRAGFESPLDPPDDDLFGNGRQVCLLVS